MNSGMKIGAAVVGGYVLGRRRKAKLAIGLGAWLVGKKLDIDPKKLILDLGHELRSAPQLETLRNQMRDELLDAGKGAAGTLLTVQSNRLAESLHTRTANLRGSGDTNTEPEPDEPESENATRRPAGETDTAGTKSSDKTRSRAKSSTSAPAAADQQVRRKSKQTRKTTSKSATSAGRDNRG